TFQFCLVPRQGLLALFDHGTLLPDLLHLRFRLCGLLPGSCLELLDPRFALVELRFKTGQALLPLFALRSGFSRLLTELCDLPLQSGLALGQFRFTTRQVLSKLFGLVALALQFVLPSLEFRSMSIDAGLSFVQPAFPLPQL